jgi:DNA-binding NarL/FixJ family response regulator
MTLAGNPPPQRARVMLVDDHDLVRQGIRSLIQDRPGLSVCAEVAAAEDALALASETRPDIVVVDISMPRVSGIDLTIQLKKLIPKIEVLVLTMHESERIVGQALRAGASGYLLKSADGEQIVEAIVALSRHRPYFSPIVSEALLQQYLKPGDFTEPLLTPRERQIVKLIAEGEGNKNIANLLQLSIKTIETHRAAAMRKIGAKSSADLTLYALRNGLVFIESHPLVS